VRLKAVPQDKCVVMHNGIDTAEFAPNPDRRAQVRTQFGVNGEFIWLTAGRLVPAKDYPNLLRALAQLRALRADAQLWVAGDNSGVEGSSLRALAAELGLEACVRWLGLRRDLPGLLDAADAFVLASAWEGMPLALGEAMAMEKPVVATDVGGIRELVAEAGVLVPPKSPDALAQAMLALMQTTPEGRGSLGQAARERIANQFSMDAIGDRWEALYTSLSQRGR
jgi:glycosyltransferase involved in cell wall biosynthesis